MFSGVGDSWTGYTRSWAAISFNSRIRLKAELDRATQEIALLRKQLRIIGVRMASIPPNRRPQYKHPERMAILELKSARNWSLERTAREFLVTAAPIASWMKRLDEQGPDALMQLREPVNKFPEYNFRGGRKPSRSSHRRSFPRSANTLVKGNRSPIASAVKLRWITTRCPSSCSSKRLASRAALQLRLPRR
jgi:hypothetical protein